MLGPHDLSENQLVPNGNTPLAHRRNGWFGEPRVVDGFRQHRRQLEPNARGILITNATGKLST